MAVWVVLLLISPGITHKPPHGSKEAGGTKMTSRTRPAFGASCQLGALLLLRVGTHLSVDESPHSMVALGFQKHKLWGFRSTNARGARSVKDQAPESTKHFIGQSK